MSEATIKKENGKLLKKKVCPVCKNEFFSNRDDAVFCDKACRQHAYRQRLKQDKIEV
ncbi:hypothetical protein [Methanosarcina sp.]|uniref:hypothetical protein n=1 Tax=Methanosarcina sp. TaxID=2213 RepID=UPI002CC70DE7|nr:hypothetical protein [Methanosarcina sp.]HOW15049.1 hypothetical protein [Methanosarcina sp.]